MGRALLLNHTHLFSPKSLFPLSLRHRPTATATATKRFFHFYPPLACRSMDHSSIDSVTQRLSNHNLHSLNLQDLKWDHSFVRELPADPRSDSFPREVLPPSPPSPFPHFLFLICALLLSGAACLLHQSITIRSGGRPSTRSLLPTSCRPTRFGPHRVSQFVAYSFIPSVFMFLS